MKNFTLTLIITLIIASITYGQEKAGSLGIGLGGASVNEKDMDGLKSSGFGLNFYLNGMYNINEHLSAGLEYNGNAAIINSINLTGAEFSVTSINGLLAKGKYVFGGSGAEPFLGFMFGLYSIRPGGIKFSVNGSSIIELNFERKRVFGIAPEFGARFKSFQLSTSFHIPGKYKANVPDGNGGLNYVELQYYVWQFNLGWNIGFGNK